MQVSHPQAERMGRATDVEHWPRQEISCMVKILLYATAASKIFSSLYHRPKGLAMGQTINYNIM